MDKLLRKNIAEYRKALETKNFQWFGYGID